MERSEPELVPEWLRCSGSVTGGSASAHHFASFSLHSDLSSSTRGRSFRSRSDKDSSRSDFLYLCFSSNSRRSASNNGSARHPYSSFMRNQRDRNCDKEKERSIGRGIWDHDVSDALADILTSRVEKNTSKRSQSLVSMKHGEALPRRGEESRNGVSSGANNLIGIQNSVFEKDFPYLGIEGKQGASCIRKMPCPGLSTAGQSLAIGSSALLGSDNWTSAMAEVPAVIGTNEHASVPQGAVATPVSPSSSSVAGLNMAEALSQAPPRVHSAIQVPDKTQRLEELAIKQSRQLIPMVPNSSDKSKQVKTAIRTSEVVMAAKNVQQQPYSSLLSHQARGVQVRSDASNTSYGCVLKPARVNGVSSTKDACSPTKTSGCEASDGQVPVAPSTPTALTSPSNPKFFTLENKAAAFSLNSRPVTVKRSSVSQAQSRSDFFNLMRKKSLNDNNNILLDSRLVVLSSEVMKGVDNSPASSDVSENRCQKSSDGGAHESQRFPGDRDKNLCVNGTFYPDEEEAAFLRSLGWDENAGEDEGLTEEEINAFYKEYMKLLPSLKLLRGTQPKFSVLSDQGDAPSESSSSGPGCGFEP